MDVKPPASPVAAAPLAMARPVFACLSLHRGDCLRLIKFPPEAVQWIEGAIADSRWPGGIQSTQGKAGSVFEFKLNGYPWNGGQATSLASRRLMVHILRTLKTHGFVIVTSTDMSRSENDKDTLIFRRVEPDANPPAMFSISLNMGDTLRLIDAPPLMDTIVGECISEYWRQGLQEKIRLSANCTEFKLQGYPWSSDSNAIVSARIFVLNLLSVLEANGWRMYASIDMSAGEADKDSWFLEAIV
ncbi:Aste57867_13813 [Aphanomyces stellatus]|uniref:Aste57867_13813 protein n=1 Tax=Aphanomyces stellatus TaxID=120398 RepID=A0A485KZ42_9STRA|nr:hypothetical protein As57867_013763 [Aphanomyces stellatus]VFT90645.1 Aste57867_13813 [Aphanomyces stellatus]